MEAKRYTIGELADATGLTVRTLHHYDRIGLLQATDRSPAGYRLYGSDDVRRLYRILALRQLGLSLKDIDTALAGDWADLRQAIARHLAEVQRQVALSRSLEHKLRRLLDQADRHQDLTNEQFIDAMETIRGHRRVPRALRDRIRANHRPALGRLARRVGEANALDSHGCRCT